MTALRVIVTSSEKNIRRQINQRNKTNNYMIDLEKVKIAKEWMNALANGYNPLDGTALDDKDIVNNVHISRCLFYVCEVLDSVGKRKSSSGKDYDLDFKLSQEDAAKVYISDRTGISIFVKEINKVIPENMKPLSATAVTSWLVRIGYLQEAVNEVGHKYKVPTANGQAIGISSELRTGPNGQYMAIDYSANAQRFILQNLFKE